MFRIALYAAEVLSKLGTSLQVYLEGAKSHMTDSPRAQGISLTPELPQALPLRKNFAWTLTGNVVYAGCQWGMLMAIAKLGTPAMLGQFALGLDTVQTL